MNQYNDVADMYNNKTESKTNETERTALHKRHNYQSTLQNNIRNSDDGSVYVFDSNKRNMMWYISMALSYEMTRPGERTNVRTNERHCYYVFVEMS